MKKITALLLAMVMVLALCACGSSGSDTAAAPAAPAAEADQAAPAAPAAPAAEAGDDFEEYKAYVTAYTNAGAPTEDEAAAVAALVDACSTPEELESVDQLTVLYQNVLLTYSDWVAAGRPAADVSNMTMGDPNAGSDEASGEPTEEPAA